jgi:hypothetical protein
LDPTRGTTTWVALAALLITSIMIGGIVTFAVEDFVPGQGSRASILTTVVIIVLFSVLVIIRQRRVRETKLEVSEEKAGPTEPESP